MPTQQRQHIARATMRHGDHLGPGKKAELKSPATMPAWPVAIAFIGFPLWWVLGLGDMAWPLFALFMFAVLARTKRLRAPRGFGMWMLFIVWVLCSMIQLDEFVRVIGFIYRFSLYMAATIVFIYVYNARRRLTERRIFAILTMFWLVVVAGGFAGLLFPVWEVKTPLAFVLPQSFLDNSYVHDMAFRRLTQFNPNPRAYVIAAPRPSAPFLYANGWGNVYSLLTPVVVVYAAMVRRGPKFWLLMLALPISFVPAVLTLNRGMFLGLGIAVAACDAAATALVGRLPRDVDARLAAGRAGTDLCCGAGGAAFTAVAWRSHRPCGLAGCGAGHAGACTGLVDPAAAWRTFVCLSAGAHIHRHRPLCLQALRCQTHSGIRCHQRSQASCRSSHDG